MTTTANSPAADSTRLIAPITCAGTPREIGSAQGEATTNRIRGCHRALRELEAFRLMKPRWLPFAAFVRLAERRATKQWQRTLASATPRMTDRADGIADAAGMRRGAVHLLNVLEPLMSDIGGQTDAPPLGGCSAIAVSGSRSAIGEPMVARNFDYLPLIQPFYIMRDTRPADGLRSLDFTCAPLAGAVDGLNEAGLCITCNYAYVNDRPSYAGTISMAIAEALARCESVEDAAEFLASRPRWGGGLLMLADESGDIASLELSNGRSALRRPRADEGVVFHTNRFQTPAMRAVELPRRARFTLRAPVALRGKVVHDSAERRQARFSELVAETGAITPDRLAVIMGDHGGECRPSNESICMHSDYWSTTATLQFFPRSRRIRVAFDSTCRATFAELEVGRNV